MYILEDVVPTTPDFSSLISALQSAITPAQLLTILTSVVGVGILFVLMWFGIRKLMGAFQTAVFKGKLRV